MSAIESPPPPAGDHSSSSAPTEEREISRRLSSSSSSVTPSFFAISSSVGARCSSFSSAGDRTLDLARARADGARHPVERAQLVDDRAANAGHRERLELDLARRIEALDRPDQAEEPVGDEVLLVDVRRQARPHSAGHELHERRVREYQPVAELLVVRLLVLLPERLGLIRRRHGKRIRRAYADSSDPPAHERAASEVGHPQRERRGGEAR